MPEYLAPGVYVEEIEIGPKPIEGVSTSTAGFLGPTERGPTTIKFITNFGDFQNKFGGFVENTYLAYGVDGFFRNGGQRCFVGRIIGKGAKTSEVEIIKKEDNTEKKIIKVKAVGPGKWGNSVAVILENASLYKLDENKKPINNLFKLTVKYWTKMKEVEGQNPEDEAIVKAQDDPDVFEIYDNLDINEVSSDYYEKRINGISNLIEIEKTADGRPDIPEDTEAKKGVVTVLLKGGTAGADLKLSDYVGDEKAKPGERTGLVAFREIDEISIVCVPDENSEEGLKGAIKDHCEKMKDRFAILQADSGPIDKDEPKLDSKYAALYYPWIKIIDPLTGNKKEVPPGGHIAGVYARSDTERGVHKAPANEVVRGVQELKFNLTKAEQDMLNPKGVNCIRAFPGRGIRVWGARTISSDPLWKYLNVRRLFLYVEESIEKGTQWVVFEPNNEKLWARVKQTITQFLTGVWRSGALMGLTPEEAFFVRCDRTTMSQDDIDNGRLIVVIGIAPVKPAEFVIFRIAQWAGGSAPTE